MHDASSVRVNNDASIVELAAEVVGSVRSRSVGDAYLP
jgi:hypothetical protein